MGKNSFILYHDMIKSVIEQLTMEQRGELFTAITEYSESGNVPEITDGMVQMGFAVIKSTLDRDAEKYEKICKIRSEAVSKRWHPEQSEEVEN